MSKCVHCNNNIKHLFFCSECRAILCNTNCLLSHLTSNHNNQTTISSMKTSIVKNKKSLTKSLSYIPGTVINMKPYRFSQDEFNKFEIVNKNNTPRLLGSGAYGDVYLTKNKDNQEYYALKKLNKKIILSKLNSLEPIKREIEIHCKLYHNNIIHFVGYFDDDTFIYLVMEYASKGNLYNSIRHKDIQNESKCAKYFSEICSAISLLHSNNIIHRDIKPENILLNDKGECKLCDFGCCNENMIGNRNTFCGTYEYMAPEILKENSYNSAVDIWSLGVLLYEMTHGFTPFNIRRNGGKKNDEVIKMIMRGQLEFSSKILSEEGKDLIRKMLCYNQNKRIKIDKVFEHAFMKKYEKKNDDREFIKVLDTRRDTKRKQIRKNSIDIEISISQIRTKDSTIINESKSLSRSVSVIKKTNYTTHTAPKRKISHLISNTNIDLTQKKTTVKQKNKENNKSTVNIKPKNYKEHSNVFSYHLHQSEKKIVKTKTFRGAQPKTLLKKINERQPTQMKLVKGVMISSKLIDAIDILNRAQIISKQVNN